MTISTISISIDKVLEDIYAASAMLTLANPGKVKPALLRRDHRPMLERAVCHSFTRLCFNLLPFIDRSEVSDASSDILTVDLRIPDGLPPSQLQTISRMIEDIVAAGAISETYVGYDGDISCRYLDESGTATIRLRRLLDTPTAATLVAS